MSNIFDLDEDEDNRTQIPMETIKCEQTLITELERNACFLLQQAMETPNISYSYDRESAIDMASTILQLIAIVKRHLKPKD